MPKTGFINVEYTITHLPDGTFKVGIKADPTEIDQSQQTVVLPETFVSSKDAEIAAREYANEYFPQPRPS